MAINIFVSNTPFQLYVVKELVNIFFKKDENIVYITFTKKHTIQGIEIREIRKNFFSIWDVIKFKKSLTEIINSSENISFFVPHINNLFSNYLYLKSIELNIKINLYYEGIALFYDPSVSLSNKTVLIRKIISFLGGISYCHSEKLFPQMLRERATAYTPLKKFTVDFKNVIEFKFNTEKKSSNYCIDKLLVIAPPLLTKIYLDSFLICCLDFVIRKNINELSVKLHYETKPYFVKEIVNFFKANSIKVELLPNDLPIELLMEDNQFGLVYSSYFSSALLNIRLIYKDKLDIYIEQKANKEFIDKLISYTSIKTF